MRGRVKRPGRVRRSRLECICRVISRLQALVVLVALGHDSLGGRRHETYLITTLQERTPVHGRHGPAHWFYQTSPRSQSLPHLPHCHNSLRPNLNLLGGRPRRTGQLVEAYTSGRVGLRLCLPGKCRGARTGGGANKPGRYPGRACSVLFRFVRNCSDLFISVRRGAAGRCLAPFRGDLWRLKVGGPVAIVSVQTVWISTQEKR